MKITVVLCILYLLGCQFVSAQKEQKNSVWYLKDARSNFTIDSLLKKNKDFSFLPKVEHSFGHDNVPFWFKVAIKNEDSVAQKKLLEVDYAYLDEVNLFLLKNDQIIYESDTLGWAFPYHKRIFKHYNPVFPISIEAKSTQIVYLRIYRHSLSMIAPIKVWNEADFYENEIKRKFFWGGFGGILAFATLLGLILFAALHQKTYLFYSLYVLMSLLYIFLNKGLFLEYYQNGFWGIYGKNVRQLFLNLQVLFILFFIRSYLYGNYKFPPLILVGFRFCIFLNLIAIPMLWYEKYAGEHNIFIPTSARVLFPIAFLLPIIFSFFLVFYNLYKKIEVLGSQIYLIGITPLVVLSTFSIPRNYGLFPNHWLLETEGIMLFYLFEIVVLSIGLGIRYKKLRDEKEYQQKLVYEGQLKLLQERANISRDLHDNVGSQLSVISSSLDNIGFLAEKQKLTSEKVESVNEFVREAIQSLRDTIWATNQETFSLAEFRARVQQYIHKYYQSETCQIIVSFDETEKTLNSTKTLNLFRIIQEALNNAVKYANSTLISVNLEIFKEQICLEIVDNGKGFDVEKTKEDPHYGLLNMQKRVNEIGGELTIKSKIGEGTKIEVIL
ncbi:hypothetical protein GCM10011514_33640 [Emticicia aquatilis]|uniref:histidine kinase n=1 Tax=Emticicia aquatilis TaxID=1537369 RepID=A0A916YYC0_9BACT|nr:7TM-DISM domain-containing protein [Emticicia aquatilis]GGD66862.1 hypothetical protein GCM10011514_33640 [Emticicia aquatilis]